MCENTRAYQMTNSHILVQQFDYLEPATLDEAIVMLQEHGDRARLVAGGTSLLVEMKEERRAPETLINISKVPGLRSVVVDDDALSLGARVSIREISQLRAVRDHYQALREACAAFGSMQIQMMGTLGGNLCNGSPASDTAPALMAFDARLQLVGPSGLRQAPVREFLVRPGKVALEPGEVVSHVLLPRPAASTGSAYIKITRVEADLAKVSVAVVLERDGDRVANCRIAFGSVAPTVVRAEKAEAFLQGKVFSPQLALQAGEVAKGDVSPIDDVRSTAWYRREIVRAITHDALLAAWDRAANQDAAWTPDQETLPEKAASNHHQVGKDELANITLSINGEKRRLHVSPNELLLNVLREKLEITGPKYGCGIGECGACTVIMNGRPVLGCLTLAVAADGAEITTVEGLQAPDGALHPLQQSFIDHQAFQCGYCTPGMLMMTKTLLEDIPAPAEDDVRDYLRGNRCRCTGFSSIVRAVLNVVESEPEK